MVQAFRDIMDSDLSMVPTKYDNCSVRPKVCVILLLKLGSPSYEVSSGSINPGIWKEVACTIVS